MAPDFTFAAFEELCQQITHMPVFPVAEYLARQRPPPRPFVVLRFDVDYREGHAIMMARIAARHHLQGSFYFRHPFDLTAIQAAAGLEHEVGYHFETLDTCQGNFEAAGRLFLEHLDTLRAAGLTVRTVAAHGSAPTAPTYQSNHDIFVHTPDLFQRADLLGETTLSIDFGQVVRFSDAGWRWRRYQYYQPGTRGQPSSLKAILRELSHRDAGLYVTFHPHQWFGHSLQVLYYRWRNRAGSKLLRRA